MDELLDVVDFLADAGFEGFLTWLLRIIGVIAIVAGIAVWLVTDLSVIIPAALIVGGLLLLVIPGILIALTEMA